MPEKSEFAGLKVNEEVSVCLVPPLRKHKVEWFWKKSGTFVPLFRTG